MLYAFLQGFQQPNLALQQQQSLGWWMQPDEVVAVEQIGTEEVQDLEEGAGTRFVFLRCLEHSSEPKAMPARGLLSSSASLARSGE